MKTIARTVYLYAKAPVYGTQIDYWISGNASLDAQHFGRVAATAEVFFEVPELNVIAMAIEELEAEKAEAAEKFRATMAAINDRLAKLQAISNEVAA
jgi:hypothetical protein